MMLVATKSVFVAVDGVRLKLRRGRTTAEEGAAVVAAYPDLWEPLVVDYPAEPSTPESDRPPNSAPKSAWVSYVASLGGTDLDGLKKDDLISLADQLES